jgi:two-component system, sensor histidine kinase LadS
MIHRVVMMLMLFGTFSGAQGQVLVLNESSKRFDLKGHTQHFRDSVGDASLEFIRTAAKFTTDRSVNFGFDDDVHWFKLQLRNDSPTEDFLLEIAFASLDEVHFYYPSETGWVHKFSGDEFPISVRDLEYQHPVFRFSMATGSAATVYLRVRSTSSVQVPATIWEREAFFSRAIHLQIFNGIFYGATILMIIYQLFLFLSAREKMSLYYVFTLVSMLHIVSYFQGYGFLYLYPELPKLNRYMGIFTAPLFLIFSTWFARAFLDLKNKYPVIDILLVLNVVVNVVLTTMMIIDVGNVSFRVHHYAVLMHSVLALLAAFLGIYDKFKPALYYLLSWLTLLVAAGLFSMSNLGFFKQFVNATSSALVIACLVQMLLISFALVNRWHIVVRENQLSKENEIRRKEMEREKLEEEVRLRTEEIRQKNEKLEEVNRIKDKLFSIVSHDIKGPLTSLQLALALTKNETISPKEFRELTSSLEAKFNQTTEFIENLLQWARLQLKGETFEPTHVDLQQVAATTVELFHSDLRDKSINISNFMTGPSVVFADPNMLESIMRNLVNNAIKFTQKGGMITIDQQRTNGIVTVCVKDTGVGIPLANRAKIFSLDIVTTAGTRQEKGTGLGLLLCKEFVERNGGRIWFESEEGKGSTFYFTVPGLP